MNRLSYKSMYLDAQARIDRLVADNQKLAEDLLEERRTAFRADQQKSQHRRQYSDLYPKIDRWLDTVKGLILADSVKKDGWLMIPVVAPDDAVVLDRHMEEIRLYMDRNRPPIV